MKRKDILRRLEERLARGEISEKTYLEIKARYESEPDEPEQSDVPFESMGADLGANIGSVVAQVAQEATLAAQQAAQAVGEAMRSVDLSGIGTRISDDAIKISGSGTVSGNPVRTGEFKAAGSARVQGPLEAKVARVSGSCSFEGDVTVEEFRCSGSARILGRLKAQEVEASGSLHVEGGLEAEEVMASGSLHVGGNVRAEEISASGSLQVKGGVSAEEFHSSGSIRIDGELRAEEVHIDLAGTSKIAAIEASEITVKAPGGFVRFRGDLTADRIVGEEVELEATNATFVKGNEVRIGPHCRIDVVEAKELVVHQSSEVRERRAPSEA